MEESPEVESPADFPSPGALIRLGFLAGGAGRSEQSRDSRHRTASSHPPPGISHLHRGQASQSPPARPFAPLERFNRTVIKVTTREESDRKRREGGVKVGDRPAGQPSDEGQG